MVSALHPNRLRAFTLVELLVVIGIIAVLISILLPALSSARNSANSVKCQSNLRQIVQGALMYAGDNKNIMPHEYGNGGDGAFNGAYWWVQIAPYINVQIAPPPYFPDPGFYPVLKRSSATVFECPVPNNAVPGAEYQSYLTNIAFYGGTSGLMFWAPPSFFKLTQIKTSAQKIIYRDASCPGYVYTIPQDFNDHSIFGKHGRSVPVKDMGTMSPIYTTAYTSFNAAFADGHGENIREADLGPTKYQALGGNSSTAAKQLHGRYYDLTSRN